MSLITVRDDTEEKKNVGGAVLFLINEPFQVFVLKKKRSWHSKGWNLLPFSMLSFKKKKNKFFVKEIQWVKLFDGNDWDS